LFKKLAVLRDEIEEELKNVYQLRKQLIETVEKEEIKDTNLVEI